MTDFPVITRIQQLCEHKGWSYYKLAKESSIPYSTLNTMMLKTTAPSISTLQKICSGLNITLAQFFDIKTEPVMLTPEQLNCIDLWTKLTELDKVKALAYMQGLHDARKGIE